MSFMTNILLFLSAEGAKIYSFLLWFLQFFLRRQNYFMVVLYLHEIVCLPTWSHFTHWIKQQHELPCNSHNNEINWLTKSIDSIKNTNSKVQNQESHLMAPVRWPIEQKHEEIEYIPWPWTSFIHKRLRINGNKNILQLSP